MLFAHIFLHTNLFSGCLADFHFVTDVANGGQKTRLQQFVKRNLLTFGADQINFAHVFSFLEWGVITRVSRLYGRTFLHGATLAPLSYIVV